MELPFAFESSASRSSGLQDDSSLVTASSQGSFVGSDANSFDPILIATPAAVERNRMASVLSQFGMISSDCQSSLETPGSTPEEIVDFTYVNVWESNVGSPPDDTNSVPESPRGDILSALLNGTNSDELAGLVEQANEAAQLAHEAKLQGNLQKALDAHSTAAKLFRDAANISKSHTHSMTNSFLILSQTQSKSALALKRAIKLRPNLLTLNSHQERLRAAVRGAMHSQREADISDSVFLGTGSADPSPSNSSTTGNDEKTVNSRDQNPVDDMLQLERELRDMELAVEMGNSIASMDTRSRMNRSVVDGSFMMVPGQSIPRTPSRSLTSPHTRTATNKANRNRVQSILESSRAPAPVSNSPRNQTLESSWWGGGAASQILSSSVISMATNAEPVVPMVPSAAASESSPAHTKQLIRLMDSLKALGDENAALLRQVEEADAARNEAKVVRLQMKQFKDEYSKRFDTLRAMLEKFRQGQNSTKADPVTSSEFGRSQSANTERAERQQALLIRKLTADLQKEKEENKKKEVALKKYESFYLEVKARSAQKQRQREAQHRKTAR